MESGKVPSEVEAKLLVPDEDGLRDIGRLARLGVFRLERRDTLRLYSIYFDTADFALSRCGAALRLRRQQGHWEATAKWGGEVRGEIHERTELTVPLGRRPSLPFKIPRGPLRTHLTAMLAGRALQPVLATDIMRQRIDVLRDEGNVPTVIAELALDRVQVQRPDSAVTELTYCEAEIEQRQGSRADLHEMARLLTRGFGLRASIESKFARGMQVLYGPHLLAPARYRIRPDDSLAVAVRTITNQHLRRIRRHDPGTRLGTDPEALHEQRVAVRRLRALVQVFPQGFVSRTLHSLEAELRWHGDALGTVRDLDVQLMQLERSASAAPPGHRRGYEGYRRYLKAERQRARTQLIEALDSQRYFDLLLALERFAASRPRVLRSASSGDGDVQEAAAGAGQRALKHAFRRLRRRAEKVRKAPTPEDLHALRIRAKRVRYLLEFLSDLTGKPGARLVRRLVQVQDLLGAYHDAMVTADTVRRYVEGPGSQQSAAALLALGTLVSQHLHAAEGKRAHFEQTWSRFVRPRNRRLMKAMLRRLKRHERSLRPPQPPLKDEAVKGARPRPLVLPKPAVA